MKRSTRDLLRMAAARIGAPVSFLEIGRLREFPYLLAVEIASASRMPFFFDEELAALRQFLFQRTMIDQQMVRGYTYRSRQSYFSLRRPDRTAPWDDLTGTRFNLVHVQEPGAPAFLDDILPELRSRGMLDEHRFCWIGHGSEHEAVAAPKGFFHEGTAARPPTGSLAFAGFY